MWCGCRSRSSNRDRGRTVGSAQCTVDGTAGSKLREKDTRVCVARSRGVDGDDLRRTHSDDLITDYPACGYTAVVPLTHDDRHRRHYRREAAAPTPPPPPPPAPTQPCCPSRTMTATDGTIAGCLRTASTRSAPVAFDSLASSLASR